MLKTKTPLLLMLAAGMQCYAATPDLKVQIQNDNDVKTQGPVTANTIMSDRKLQADIKDLVENKFKRYNINISVYGGNVILRGYVDSEATKKDIERDVKRMTDVKSVNNMLNISN